MSSSQPILDAVRPCQAALKDNIQIARLMRYEWAQNRLADFNLWCAGLGVQARSRLSLDYRLQEKPLIRHALTSLLNMLHFFLIECGQIGHTLSNFHDVTASSESDRSAGTDLIKPSETLSQKDQSSTSDIEINCLESDLSNAFDAVEDLLMQLTWLSMAIRRSGTATRLERADQRFRSGDHQKFRKHLELILTTRAQEHGGPIIEPQPLTEIQQRLISTNMRRRHRFKYAQKHAEALSKEPDYNQDPSTVPNSRQDQLIPERPAPRPKDSSPERLGDHESMPTQHQHANSTVATEPEESLLDFAPQQQGSVNSRLTATGLKLDYPLPPRIKDDHNVFRCPCCCQTLSGEIARSLSREWRGHIQEDVCPYTCILEGCSDPEAMYQTRKEWLAHMKKPHKNRDIWCCLVCHESKPFLEKNQFEAHLRHNHSSGITEAQLPLVISMSTRAAPIEICPVCNEDPSRSAREDDAGNPFGHIAKCLHSFSLRALPWAKRDRHGFEPPQEGWISLERKVVDWLYAIAPDNLAKVYQTSSSTAGRMTDIRESTMFESSEDETSYFENAEYFKEADVSTQTNQSGEGRSSAQSSYESTPSRLSFESDPSRDNGNFTEARKPQWLNYGYAPHVKDFLAHMENAKVPGRSSTNINDRDRHSLIPPSKILEFFKAGNSIKPILDSVLMGVTPNAVHDTVINKYLTVLCILLYIDKGSFFAQFLRQQSLTDFELPFTTRPIDFPISSVNDDLYDTFHKAQWMFCPAVFEDREKVVILNDFILPINEIKSIGAEHSTTENNAKITKVKIWAEFFHSMKSHASDSIQESDADRKVFAMKTYRTISKKVTFDNEVDAFYRITRSGQLHRAMIGFHGAFTYKETYNLLLEYANQGTLEEYLKNQDPPYEPDDILSFWRNMLDVVGALQRIHEINGEDEEGGIVMNGVHQDISPANILVVGAENKSRYSWKFKLGNLGLAHFKAVDARSGIATRREKYGTKTYGAPECYRADQSEMSSRVRITTAADIYSLGAVFSEVVTWLIFDTKGIEVYGNERVNAHNRIHGFRNPGCFHDGEKTLHEVWKRHMQCREGARNHDTVTTKIIDNIEKMLQEDPRSRPSALMLARWFTEELGAWNLEDISNPGEITPFHPGAEQASVRSKGKLRAYSDSPETPRGSVLSTSTTSQEQSLANRSKSILDDATPKPNPPTLSLENTLKWMKCKKDGEPYGIDGENLLAELGKRDIVFLFDESPTMKVHLENAVSMLSVLAYMLKNCDPDGMALRFVGGADKNLRSKHSTKLTKELRKVSFSAHNLNIVPRLEEILRGYELKLNENKSKAPANISKRFLFMRPQTVSPLNLYIFTDGVWQPRVDPSSAIKRLANVLDALEMPKAQVGIQFIRFGDDRIGLERLEYLDSKKRIRLKRDIVDTTPFKDANIWKIILGATNKWFDDDPDEGEFDADAPLEPFPGP